MKARGIIALTSTFLFWGLIACSDDGDPSADTGPDEAGLDASADVGGAEAGAEAGTEAGAEASVDATPSGAVCAKAATLTLTANAGSVSGAVAVTDTDNDAELPATGCTTQKMQGAEDVFRVTLTAGVKYYFKAAASASYNHGIYLLSGCAAPLTSCVAGADARYAGSEEMFTYTPVASGVHYLVIDSRYAAGSGNSYGTYTLTVGQAKTPANDTCAGAAVMAWSGTKASAAGDTGLFVTDTVNLAATGCTADDTEGADLFYEVALTAGKSYQIKVSPAAGYDAALYLLSGCASPTSACTKGADTGYSGSAEAITVTPTTSGTQIIAVDSSYASSSAYGTGGFTLDVVEAVIPKNDACAAAEVIPLTGGTGKATGNSTYANNSVSLTSSSCVGAATAGPDMFYAFSATAGQMYKITVTPSSSYDPAIYAFTSCAAVGAFCAAGSDTGSAGTVEIIAFTAKTSGAHTIGVDSSSTSNTSGSFTVDVAPYAVPKNDTCGAAKVVTLTAGKATVTEYKTGATDALASCGATSLPATDLWYRFTPTTGKTYKITFKPAGNGGRFGVWDGSHGCVASAVQTACGVLGSTYVSGGGADSITITSASGDIYFVADGVDTTLYDVYGYTFEIEQQP